MLLLILVLLLAPSAQAATNAHSEWIRTAQSSDCAIHTHTDQQHVAPYNGHQAALGLVISGRRDANPAYVTAAKCWINWNRSHQSTTAGSSLGVYVNDWDRVNGVLVNSGDADSTDSYCAYALLVMRAIYDERAGQIPWLEAREDFIADQYECIASTLDSRGRLTYAKPSWNFKYAMDNAEVLAGLRAGERLALAVSNTPLYFNFLALAENIKFGLASLWNPATESYDVSEHEDGTRHVVNWSEFYPDAFAQGLICSLVSAEVPSGRCGALLDHLEQEHPDWSDPATIPDLYWPQVAVANIKAGDAARGVAGAEQIEDYALSVNRVWPFTPGDAGQLILAGR